MPECIRMKVVNACRKPESCGSITDLASSTINLLRRKVKNLEDENVNLKVWTFSLINDIKHENKKLSYRRETARQLQRQGEGD